MLPTDPLEHPQEWKVVKVGDVVEIRRGISWSKDQEESEPKQSNNPVIKIGNVQEHLDLSDILYIRGLPPKAVTAKKVTKDWSIVVGSNGNRARIGNAVYITEDMDYLFASFLIAVKPMEDSGITPKFFFEWLSSKGVQERLSMTSEGSTGLSNLSHNFFKAMHIAFPKPKEQVAIVRILEKVDLVIARTQEVLEKVHRVKRGLMQEIFGDRKHSLERLGTYINEISYGTSQASNDKRHGYPTLRIPNIIGRDINTIDLTYVDASELDCHRYTLKEGDLVLVRTNGNPSYIGRSAVFQQYDLQQWLYASYLIRVRFDERLLPRYVDEYLKSERGKRELFRRVTTSAGNYNINTMNIKSLQIPIVDINGQIEAIRLADAANRSIESYESQYNKLQCLKRGLMQDLLTGKVRTVQPMEAVIA